MPAQPTAPPPGGVVTDDPTAVCVRSIHIMATGDRADFEDVIHPEAVNRDASAEPRTARGHGPAAFHATALWLRAAFADMAWEVNEVAAAGDLVVIHITASSRHAGPFVIYDESGQVAQAMPPTGKTCSITQTHWFRLADGKVIEHWANRDDMGMARQLGWIPPSPRYLVRMAIAKRRARRAA
jgi:predicted ester cyclase